MDGTLTLFLNVYQDYKLFIKYQVITTEYNPNALQCSINRLPLDKDNVIQRSFSIFERVCQRTFQFFLLNFQLLMYSIGQVFAHSGELVQKKIPTKCKLMLVRNTCTELLPLKKKALLQFSFNHNAMKFIQM